MSSKKSAAVYTEDYIGKSGKTSLLISIPQSDLDVDEAHALGMQGGYNKTPMEGYWVRWTSKDSKGKKLAAAIAGLLGTTPEHITSSDDDDE